MITRPMLAGKAPANLDDLNYPVLATPKIDGIRCLKINGKAVSRSFKPIRNNFIREWIETNLPDGVDGELVVKGADFSTSASGVMSEFGEPNFEYKVFDFVRDLSERYDSRVSRLSDLTITDPGKVTLILPLSMSSEVQLLDYEQTCLSSGYEGVMIRDPKGPYKCGRSTMKEGWLLKLKRFEDGEAIIIGFQELYRNENPQEEDAFGNAKRSGHQDNLRPAGTLGALTVIDIVTKKTFAIGTGFDQALRKKIWENKSEYINKLVKYKWQVHGTVDLPRMPVFLGLRDPRDMSFIVDVSTLLPSTE